MARGDRRSWFLVLGGAFLVALAVALLVLWLYKPSQPSQEPQEEVGVRQSLPPGLASFVGRVRATTDKPLAVGFGIGQPEQAAQVARLADGVIVGSALVRLAGEPDGRERVGAFVASLRRVTAARDA